MSYPTIGMPGILPEGEEWGTKTIEKMLRDGRHIYMEEDCYSCGGTGGTLQIVSFENGKFRMEGQFGDLVHEDEDFVEFMSHVLFFGRDFL